MDIFPELCHKGDSSRPQPEKEMVPLENSWSGWCWSEKQASIRPSREREPKGSAEECVRIPELQRQGQESDLETMPCIYQEFRNSPCEFKSPISAGFQGKFILSLFVPCDMPQRPIWQLHLKWQNFKRKRSYKLQGLIHKRHVGNICLSLYGMDFFFFFLKILSST